MYTSIIAFFMVSICISFLCSLWEAVLLSISPPYTQLKVNEGKKIGLILKDFKANIDKPLATILTLNTIAHTVGAIGVGEQATKIWANANPIITAFIVPATMTAAILILSEIIPKTIGANNWKFFAPFTVRCLNIIQIILFPFVYVCQIITRLICKNQHGKSIFSRSDFLAITQICNEDGSIDNTEAKFINHLLGFKEFCASDIMTPRTVAIIASEEMTAREFYDVQEELIFSRVPIYKDGNKDLITGYVLKDEILEYIVDGEPHKALRELKREIIVVEGNYSILTLFHDFIAKREHIALVSDPYGGMAGIVTMEDIIETLIGTEIVDETDEEVDLQALARKLWEKRFKKYEAKKSDIAKAKE